MNSWLYSSKADSDFDEQTTTDDHSERQDLSIIHAMTLMDLHKMLPTMLPTYVVLKVLIPARIKKGRLLSWHLEITEHGF